MVCTCMAATIKSPSRLARPHSVFRARTLSEVFAETALDAGPSAFVLASLPRHSKPVLWVQDRLSTKEAGDPYLLDVPLLRVQLSRPADVLQAMEDGLGCSALGAVVGEVWGDPHALGFTATKRLVMRAEASDMPCWLVRRASAPALSAARNRWRVTSLPAAAHPDDPRAPGQPRWRAELFRSRMAPPAEWVVRHDRAADRIHFSAPLRDGALAEGDGTRGQFRAR